MSCQRSYPQFSNNKINPRRISNDDGRGSHLFWIIAEVIMLCNCQRSSGVVSNVPELVRDKLEAVARIYPHTKYVCVLDSSGELMYYFES